MAAFCQPEYVFAAGFFYADFGALCLDPAASFSEEHFLLFLRLQGFTHQNSKDPNSYTNLNPFLGQL